MTRLTIEKTWLGAVLFCSLAASAANAQFDFDYGACCYPNGCIYGPDITCLGTYLGDGTTCEADGDACLGACCATDGSCEEVIQDNCSEGSFLGMGTTCADTSCTVACCLSDGSCEEETVDDCIALGGLAGDAGSTCETFLCPTPTPFTYQGRLQKNGEAYTGTADLKFTLWDNPGGGLQVGATQTINNVNINDGLLTAQLDFGVEVFNGQPRWIEVAVRAPAGSEDEFVPLLPRQTITATPYALQTRGMFTDEDGNVGFGTTVPQHRLDVAGTARVSSLILPTGAGASKVLTSDTAGNATWTTPQPLFWQASTGGISFNDGNVGIGTDAPTVRLHVIGGIDTSPGGGGYLVLGDTSAANVSIDDNEIMARNNGGVVPLHLQANGGDVIVGQSGNSVLSTPILEITGGSDLSEQFDVSAGGDIEPGMVVSIDPANAGKLVVAARAYDKRVAGILSGAGGVKTGMRMGQQGSLADGEHAVALTGRAYCLVDASNGAIEPGDLLTTSDTPGHAMKVTDHNLAQGAIIGKAMTSFESGTGLVLVLVSLQ